MRLPAHFSFLHTQQHTHKYWLLAQQLMAIGCNVLLVDLLSICHINSYESRGGASKFSWLNPPIPPPPRSGRIILMGVHTVICSVKKHYARNRG
jgi:hypothetical protein